MVDNYHVQEMKNIYHSHIFLSCSTKLMYEEVAGKSALVRIYKNDSCKFAKLCIELTT